MAGRQSLSHLRTGVTRFADHTRTRRSLLQKQSCIILRRNILAHGIYPNAPYFLMVFPDRFYLWKNAEPSLAPIEPTAKIDARPILQPYLDKSGIAADAISGASLEFIVASWLNGLLHKSLGELDASEQWLVDLGLYDAIAGGTLSREVYA